jgi:CheY-like chemotaxis protein
MTQGSTHEPHDVDRFVLIVDDDPDIREVLSMVLETRGFHTATAEDGEAALRVMRDGKPALVLADLMMPIMTGAQLVLTMKQDPRLSDVPVLLVTAWPANAGDLGADELLTKPVDVDHLLHSVRKYVH